MVSEYEEMPYDADVVARVLDKRDDITPKTVARHYHCNVATVYRYLSGDRTIPSGFLRAVFELTGDFQILGLITGTVPVTFQAINTDHKPGCPNAQQVRIPPIAELTDMSCKAVELAASSTRYLCKALRDGKLDISDRHDLECYKKTIAEAMRCHSLLVAATEVEMRKAGL